jgi:hypothetical protein
MLNDFEFIDIHYHAAPDLYYRRHNAISAGKLYQDINGAVVLKSHLGSTSVQATLAQQEGLPVFPSVALNQFSGGIDYKVVLRALAEYQPQYVSRLIVDLPTITCQPHQSKLPRKLAVGNLGKHALVPTALFDEKQRLKSEVIDLIKFARDYPVVLSTGHASKEEVYALIDTCHQHNLPRLLLNQPANPLTNLDAQALAELAKDDLIWIEQTALTYLLGYQQVSDFKEVLASVPKVIYSSDLGQTSQMDIMNWKKQTQQWFEEVKLSQDRRKEICLTNPHQLLSI